MANSILLAIKTGFRVLRVFPNTGPAYDLAGADNEPERPTYHGALFNLQPTGTCTDIIALGGAAGKVIRLKELTVSGTATSATNIGLYVYKRTAIYTGGTPTAVTRTASSTSDLASVASLNHYAAGPPTPGAGSMMKAIRLNLAPAANGGIDRYEWDFSWKNDKAPMVESATEFLALGMNSVAMPSGGGLDIAMTWTEE